MKKVTILGSTGSIGTSTLDVIRRNHLHFQVYALAAGKNLGLLAEQIEEFRPEVVVVDQVDALAELLKTRGLALPELTDDLISISVEPSVDVVMSSIVGVAGLPATYAAIQAGKRIGLANKEVLVSAGDLVMKAVRAARAEMIPVDSEHNGAHQCLRAGLRAEATKLILTASGGPLRNTPKSALASVTPEQALKHPTWKMGNRISIDSATLMNKGFEVIEACWLFDFAPQDVEVVVHPQSTVHAMVEYNDGSVIAQVSATDMRMPIQYALTWPDRCPAPVPKIDWSQTRSWDFAAPDLDRFPALRLAYESLAAGGSACCTMNAADEIAVEAFLAGRIGFTNIAQVIQETLEDVPNSRPSSIGDILDIDDRSRRVARQLVDRVRV